MNSIDGLRVLALLRVLCFGVEGVPLSEEYDIWIDGDGGENFVNESEVDDRGRDGKGLNFSTKPVKRECFLKDRRRKGICINSYDCHSQRGTSHGPCARGLGVCCVFTATCSKEVINNITYFVNPDFPDLLKGMSTCELTVKKIDPEVAQLRLDFIHFTLGQPNRKTGYCEEEVFVLSGGSSKDLRLCGLNSGQHVYFDVQNVDTTIKINMNMSKKTVSRLWEVRITQIPFLQEAPSGCLQYHTGVKGEVQTMNFAENGRHLADQDYMICIRQEEDMCSIVYEPCDESSFRIGPNNNETCMMNIVDDGSGDGEMESKALVEMCIDRITIPCASDDLLMMDELTPGFCTMTHCGNSLCPEEINPCKIESTATPFKIGVHFSANAKEQPPDDNLGMCLTYQQLPCKV